MSRNSGIAMAAGGAAVGAAMGNAIGNSVRMRSFRKKMVDELISDFGALIATETVVYWVQNDGSTDFAYREYADKQVQNRIYQDVMACYGERRLISLTSEYRNRGRRGWHLTLARGSGIFWKQKG